LERNAWSADLLEIVEAAFAALTWRALGSGFAPPQAAPRPGKRGGKMGADQATAFSGAWNGEAMEGTRNPAPSL
jgi:hypothetical protein